MSCHARLKDIVNCTLAMDFMTHCITDALSGGDLDTKLRNSMNAIRLNRKGVTVYTGVSAS